MTIVLLMGGSVFACLAIAAAPLPSSAMVNPDSSRAASLRRGEARLAATVFALTVLAVFVLLGLHEGSTRMVVPLSLLTLAGLVAVHPWLAVRCVCIPLGLPRMAVWWSRLGGHPWVRDPEGGAVLAGALALLRRPVDEERRTWLTAQLRRGPLRGAGIVAAGLLAAEHGDRDRARALLSSLDDLDPTLCPPLARRVALDWLVADAVRQADWDRVVILAEDHPNSSRTVRLMETIARVHRGERAPKPWRAWLLAPHRRHTWSLVRRAQTEPACAQPLRFRPIELPDEPLLAANDGGSTSTQAFALHVEAMVDEPAPHARGQIDRLGAAWDRAFDDFGLRGRVRRRAEALRCTVLGEKIMARLHREVCEDLAQLLVHRGIAPEGDTRSGTMRRAAQRVRDLVVAHIEHCAIDLDGPHPEYATVDDVVTRWLAWLDVRRAYLERAPMLPIDLRRDVYAIVELHSRQLMAWLWNDQGERGLANAISSWLMLEAERVHDEESAAYHRHNVALVI